MTQRPTYDEAFEVISLYAPDMQPLFADGWSRWPVYPVAGTIIDKLEASATWWSKRHPDIAETIQSVASEIRARA